MTDFIIPLRWIHVLSGMAWFGEVITINFALLPFLSKLPQPDRKKVLIFLFPKIFHLATVLSLTAVISGALLAFLHAGTNMNLYFGTKWGNSILIGGGIGVLLTVFHLFLEEKVGRKLLREENINKDEMLGEIHSKLNIIPRIGLAVITSTVLLMMYAAHGF